MKLTYILIFLISFSSFSQRNYEDMLNRVSSKTQAEVFLKRFKSQIKGELINVTADNPLYTSLKLDEAKKGDTKTEDTSSGKVTYKILGKTKGKSTSYKASIMEFDSNEMPISEINSLRAFILKGLKSGEHKFENLARVYSSHTTAKTGGDLGWTPKGTFSARFEKAIADKRIGQAFSFDEHREKKHYVIVKTESNKSLESITVLKITEVN